MSTDGIAVTWSINFEEVGITLKVTPMITEDGQISLELKPSVSEKTGDYTLTVVQGTTKIPYSVPIVDTRSADTKVVIGNGQTLIIGGLIKETNTKGVTKVPFLGDIPGIKWLFRSTKDTKDKTELLIFVSPTIINPSILAYMGSKEKLGIGKWYMKERADKDKKLLAAKSIKRNFILRVDSMNKELSNITVQRRKLEKVVKAIK